MSHAFSWLAPTWRLPLFVVALLATLSVAWALGRQGRPLRTTVPNGVVTFEFAWTREAAERVVQAWSGDLKETALTQLRLDFLFLLLYPVALALGCALLSQSSANRLAPVGVFLSYVLLAAAPLDAGENLALSRMLTSGTSEALARLATVCAGLKFTLVYAGLGYLALQGLSVLCAWMRGPR